jgi:hypothetical protein
MIITWDCLKGNTKETLPEVERRKGHIGIARKTLFLHISMEIYNRSKSSSSTLMCSAYEVK